LRTVFSGDLRWLWIIAAIFVLLGWGYSSLTPIFEQSDETLHYPYVKTLADGNGLPLAAPGQLWNQEATQPPLYYAIVAATTFWIDSNNLSEHLQYNPHWLFTEVRFLINDNQNRVLHGPMDEFPYSKAALAIHIGRWWSLFFGLVTVICTFFIVKRLAPGNLPLLITTTSLVAFTPQFIRISATVSNDSLSAALTTLAVLLALRFTEPANPGSDRQRLPRQAIKFNNGHALLLGVVAGLALLTKLSSVTTFVLVALILFWRLVLMGEMHQRPWWNLARWLLLLGIVTFALNFWYLWRNYQLYGEWLATEIHLDLAGRGDLSLSQVWALRGEAEWAYWATFGWGQIRLPEWVYSGFALFSRVGLAGVSWALIYQLALARRGSPGAKLSPDIIIFLLIWAAMNVVLYIRWVTSVGSVSHTRLVFPAITAISLLFAVGWHSLIPVRFERWFSGAVMAVFIMLNFYVLAQLLYPAFIPTPGYAAPQSANNHLEVTFADSLQLVGGQADSVNSTDTILIQAEWRVLANMDKNYSVAATLLAPDGSALAQRQTYPGLGLRPARYLTPGATFTDVYPLTPEIAVSEPLVARATISLFDFESDDRSGFPALDGNGHETTPVVGLVKLVPDPWPVYHPQHNTAVNFGSTVRLTGYDLSVTENGYDLTLYWEPLSPPAEDFTLFLHLLNANGDIVSQADRPPTGGAYPTSWWALGEHIADRHSLLPAAEVTALKLGLYSPQSGQRLPVADSSLPVQDNGVIIKLEP
jgi:hypothetical protein